jgi:uncharacterized protein (TIGR02145 family)
MSKVKLILLAASSLLAMAFTFSCSDDALTDLTDPRDSKVYKTIKIGKQVWMAENLNYDGEDKKHMVIEALKGHSIPYNGDGRVGKCYDNDPANCEKYGRLYDWSEAMGSLSEVYGTYNLSITGLSDVKYRGICPDGWHLPSWPEFITLYKYIGGNDYSYEEVTAKLKAQSGWKDGNGTDDYGFAALPGGMYNCFYYYELICVSGFSSLDIASMWWTATESEYMAYMARDWRMFNDNSGSAIFEKEKVSSMSVRCLKN